MQRRQTRVSSHLRILRRVATALPEANLCDEDVARRQVAVDERVGVDVLQPAEDLEIARAGKGRLALEAGEKTWREGSKRSSALRETAVVFNV
eukprot:4232543-Pleurochrysis_carterae.AAC.1